MKPKPRRKSRDISHCDPCYISFLVSIVGYPDVVIWAVVDTCFRLFFFFVADGFVKTSSLLSV